MQVYDCDHYTGIRFHGKNNKVILEKIWKQSSQGMWLTYDVPCKSEICGIGATMSAMDTYIIQVGFLLWQPAIFNYHTGAPDLSLTEIARMKEKYKSYQQDPHG